MLDPWSYAEKTNTEHAHQAALFMWANMAAEFGIYAGQHVQSYTNKGFAKVIADKSNDKFPQLKWLHAIPNQGTESAKRGLAMKAEGLKSGVYDMFLPWPKYYEFQAADATVDCTEYCGLYIEMKRPKTATQAGGKLSDEQKEFKAYAESVGYKCVECWSWLEARDAILQYLGVIK